MMHWRKCLVIMTFVLGITVGLCGLSFAQETVTFTHWTFREPGIEKFWEILIPEFEKEYPNIKAIKHEIPKPLYWNKLLVLVSAGPAPDVIGTIPVLLKQWMAMDAVEPLEPLMNLTEIKRTFLSQQKTFCMENGKTFAVTQGARPLVLIYNEKLFEEAGIANAPSLPPELVATSLKLTQPEKGQYGLGLKVDEKDYSDTYDCLVNFPLGYGGNFATNGIPTATDPNTILGVKLYKLLCDLKVTPVGQDQKITREMLYKGKVAMFLGGPWNLTETEIKNPETYKYLNATMTPFANKACTGGAHHFLVIPRLAKNKSAGAKFIEFCMREKYLRLYNDFLGMVPGNPDFASEKLLKETKWFKAFVEGLDYATVAIPEGFAEVTSEYTRIVIHHVVGNIVMKDQPVEETLERCQLELLKLAEERETK